MGDVPQMGPFGPLGPGFDLSQLVRMLQSEGPVNWEVARQVAAWIAVTDPTSGQPGDDVAVDPAAATALADLARAAQAAVAPATGIAEVHLLQSECVDRRTWAERTLEGLHPVLEALARSMEAPLAGLEGEGDEQDPLAGLVGAMMPILVGVQAGSMIGFLAQQALGQYDLALPLTGSPALRFVSGNVDRFAAAWSLPLDELRYTLAVREVVRAAPRCVPWVRDHLVALCRDYVGAYELHPERLEEQLGDFDPTNLAGLAGMTSVPEGLADPDALLGAMRSERQEPLLRELRRFVSVLEGYADVVVARLGEPMVSSFGQIDEALRRLRVDRGQAASFVGRLLGLELDRWHYAQGVAFCEGVVERGGPEALNRLWEDASMLPTEPELEAPGLWLARIEL